MGCAIVLPSADAEKNHVCEFMSGFDENVPTIFLCQICPMHLNLKFYSIENLRKHYCVAHYQTFFMKSHPQTRSGPQSFPVKCCKKNPICLKVITNSRNLALHFGVDHRKLRKAMQKPNLFGSDEAQNEVIKQISHPGEDGSRTSDSMQSPVLATSGTGNGIRRTSATENNVTNKRPPIPTQSKVSPDLIPDETSTSDKTSFGKKGLKCPVCKNVISGPLAGHIAYNHYR